jgi:hypothetical protein
MNSKNEFLLTGGVTMRRLLTILAIGAVFCLFVALASEAKKPGEGPGPGIRTNTQLCLIGNYPDPSVPSPTAIILDSGGVKVEVGVDDMSWTPVTEHTCLNVDVSGETWNPGTTVANHPLPADLYCGTARVIKSPSGSRLEFLFNSGQDGDYRDCTADNTFDQDSPCDYRLRLVQGAYTKRAGVVRFTPTDDSGITLYHKFQSTPDPHENYEVVVGQLGMINGGPLEHSGVWIYDFSEP